MTRAMVFGNRTLAIHLARGLVGIGAMAASILTMDRHWWPSLVLLPVAVWMLKGCPVCWLVGLFETLAHAVLRRSEDAQMPASTSQATAVSLPAGRNDRR